MNCPSCGRPIEFEEKYMKVVSCPYCNSILEFGSGELTKVGEQGYFIDFPTQFIVGKEIEWNNKNVYVKGQLRYEYDGGFFDMFFVIIDGKEFYIKEDDGLKKILKIGDWNIKKDSLLDNEPGNFLELFDKQIFIQEVGLYKLTNIKGFVNTSLLIGKEYEYLDGIIDGKIISLERDIYNSKIRIISEI